MLNGAPATPGSPAAAVGRWRRSRSGKFPFAAVVNPGTRTLYVANAGGGSISVINGATCNATTTRGCGRPARTVTDAAGPSWLDVDTATDTVYVANSGHGPGHRVSDRRRHLQRAHRQWLRPRPGDRHGGRPTRSRSPSTRPATPFTSPTTSTASTRDRCRSSTAPPATPTTTAGCGRTPPAVPTGIARQLRRGRQRAAHRLRESMPATTRCRRSTPGPATAP